MAENAGTILPVVRAKGFRACVRVNGEVVVASGKGLGLSPAAEYLPVIVSLRELKAGSTFSSVSIGNNPAQKSTFGFSAKLVSPFLLKDVFLVLEINTPAGKTLFLGEVGTLPPYEAVAVTENVPLPAAMGNSNYQIHLFSAGSEVFHSEMPFDYREAMLDRMVYARIKDALVDAPPRPFVGPAPEYPRRLRAAGARGEAVVTIHISPRGVVLDPVVKRASDPAFGEAALAAVRQWRYLPRISLGQPVESTIDVPFAFTPPSA